MPLPGRDQTALRHTHGSPWEQQTDAGPCLLPRPQPHTPQPAARNARRANARISRGAQRKYRASRGEILPSTPIPSARFRSQTARKNRDGIPPPKIPRPLAAVPGWGMDSIPLDSSLHFTCPAGLWAFRDLPITQGPHTNPGVKTSFQPYTRRVAFAETDAAGVVHFSRLPVILEEAVHDFFRQMGIPVFEPGGLGWPVVALGIDYRSPARFGEKLTVELAIPKLGRSSAAFNFLCRNGDRTVCEGRMTLCLTDFTAGKAVEIPLDWRGKCGCNFSADGQASVSHD